MAEPIKSSLLQGALDDGDWSGILAGLSRSCGDAVVCVFQGILGSPPEVEIWTHGLDGDVARGADCALFDIDRSPFVAPMRRLPLGAVQDRRKIISNDAFDRSADCEALRERDIYHGALVQLDRSFGTSAGAWIGLPRSREDACDEIAGAFSAWLPILRLLLLQRMQLRRVLQINASLADVLARADLGVAIVDRDLRVQDLNDEAERIFAADDGITVRSGRLAITHPHWRRDLPFWGRPSMGVKSASFQILRRSGLPAYRLEVAAGCDPGPAVVFIRDPLHARLPQLQDLVGWYGLTHAEARVAQVVPLALSKPQIAKRLGLSENTVKSHIATIRAKARARNMTELAMLLRRL